MIVGAAASMGSVKGRPGLTPATPQLGTRRPCGQTAVATGEPHSPLSGPLAASSEAVGLPTEMGGRPLYDKVPLKTRGRGNR